MPAVRSRADACLLGGAAVATAALVAASLAATAPPGARGLSPAAATHQASARAGGHAPGSAHVQAGTRINRRQAVEPRGAAVHAEAPRSTAASATSTAGAGSATATTSTAATGSAIDPTLQARLERKLSRSTAGVYGLVVDIDGVGRVASVNPHRALRPASSQKLFTTLPLLLADPERRLVTDVVIAGYPVRGVVHGNLIVRAAADPSLSVKDVNRLARQVRAAGIRKVTGQLRVDIGSMSLRTTQTGWKADFVPDDIGPLSPFPVGRDWWRRDNAYLQHPTARNLQLFRDRLAHQGVRIRGGNLVVRDSNAHQVVAVHRSNPMRALVHRTLTYSDNFYAESLLTVAGGHRAVAQTTAAAGVTDRSEATDGSGLSYDDRETAAGEVQLLHYAFTSPARGPLVHALPIACKTGTLEHRFCGTIAAGAVFAKTGTLDHSRVLSGYTTDGLGRLVTFTVICAQVRNLTKAADATDRAVVLLRGYTG